LVEQKMEREKLEKLRIADKDKAEAAKRATAGKGDKVINCYSTTVVINRPTLLD
jgi:hypothetical protein